MKGFCRCLQSSQVALLAEGVDRNWKCLLTNSAVCRSPSSRRAWIEMCDRGCATRGREVALLAEGVDRNMCLLEGKKHRSGRPPRGGRG